MRVLQAAEAAAAATSTAAAMQQQQTQQAMTGYGQPETITSQQDDGVGISSLDSRLAQGRNRRTTGQQAAVGGGRAANNDDWGEEPLGEDLLPM